MLRNAISKLHAESKESNLLLFIILALATFVVIVVGAFIFVRQSYKYSTEVYFPNTDSLPELVMPENNYSFNITIVNLEKADMNYMINITATENNVTSFLYTGFFAVPRYGVENITLNYSLNDFRRAKIVTTVHNRNHQMYFFVYNEKITVKYPDTIAYVDCLKNITITPQDSFMIRAKGEFSPNLKIRINGTEVFSTVVNNTEYENITVDYPIGKGILDIVFDNDYVNRTENKTAEVDRNLLIEYLLIGKTKVYPIEFTAEQGKPIYAFDCMDRMENITWGLSWNGALRANIVDK